MQRVLLVLALLLLSTQESFPQFTIPQHTGAVVSAAIGPVFASAVHCQSVAFVTGNTSGCGITAAGGETVFILAYDTTGGNTATIGASSGATPTLCTGYPVTQGDITAYLWKVSIASGATYTYTATWASAITFAPISILAATNVTSSACDSTLANSGSTSTTTTLPGVSFSNSAHALAFCFISPDANYATTSSGSTFTMTAVDTGAGTYVTPSDGQGGIASAGSNNCSWSLAAGSATNWIQSEVVLQ